MKKAYKLLAMLTALIMILGVMPTAAFGASGGACGDNLTWVLDNGTLIISGTGEMTEKPWSDYKKDIKSVVINEGVTSIIGSAFLGCSALTSVSIPSGVKKIGYGAFEFCRKLTNIDVDNNNLFYMSIDGVLFNKDRTELVSYPEGKSESSYAVPNGVTSIGYSAFSWCANLKAIVLPDSVTSIDDSAFAWCMSLTNITIPKNVSSIGKFVFVDCSSLTEINVDENNSSYISIDGVLFNKDKTTLVAYPAGKSDNSYTVLENVKSIGGYAFYNCPNLENITVPRGVTRIGDSAFFGCTALTDVYYNSIEENWKKVTVEISNEPLINATIHYAPVAITAELGWNDNAFTINYIFDGTFVENTGVDVSFQGSEEVVSADHVEGFAGIGFATVNTNRIYTATPWVKVGGNKLFGTPVTTSIYKLVTDAIATGKYNYENKIVPQRLKALNEVIKNGGIYLVKNGNSYRLTDETANILTLESLENNTAVLKLTENAKNAGLSFNILEGATENGKITVHIDGTVQTFEAEVILLNAIQLEFVPEEVKEEVIDEVEIVYDFTEEIL